MSVLLIAVADLPGEAYAETADMTDETRQATAAVKQPYLDRARAGGDPLPPISPTQAGNS